jgi:hypothetical protein
MHFDECECENDAMAGSWIIQSESFSLHRRRGAQSRPERAPGFSPSQGEAMALEGTMSELTLSILCIVCIFLALMGMLTNVINRSWVQASTVYVIAGVACGGILRAVYGSRAQENLAQGLVFDDDFYFRVRGAVPASRGSALSLLAERLWP